MITSHGKYRFPWRSGNRFRLLVDGDRFFPAMEASIAEARRYVLVEMYLCESGQVTERFFRQLRAAAKRGVRVCVLLDAYGALGLRRSDRKRLTDAGAELAFYNPLRFFRWRSNLLRDHRKLLIVDGNIAFTGGTGLIDSFDPRIESGTWWHEVMLEVRGPCLADWQALFARTWNRWANSALSEVPGGAWQQSDGCQGRVTVQRGIKGRSEIMRSYVRQTRRARRRVWLATAYFVPSWKLRQVLRRSARRGRDVRLLLPGALSDHPAVWYMGRRYYHRLLKAGVRIFEYQPRFTHFKMLLCDDWLSLGSSNADAWNYRWNLEANQEVQDVDLSEQAASLLEADFARSVEIRLEDWVVRSWRKRLREWFWGKVQAFLGWFSDRDVTRQNLDREL
ncbi:cardiolipin synthase, putative [Syntrophotalea carbinolica DSM 2380]|uniref:Cardiolipin synthase, putative n=2 Tax=Syntrophotalea carbinolica TaxID=19 RepID=Q3A7W2_SYNC1|nr:cardiolipin synthase, putative [Syntrophotalea carbinolica DSM 2380]